MLNYNHLLGKLLFLRPSEIQDEAVYKLFHIGIEPADWCSPKSNELAGQLLDAGSIIPISFRSVRSGKVEVTGLLSEVTGSFVLDLTKLDRNVTRPLGTEGVELTNPFGNTRSIDVLVPKGTKLVAGHFLYFNPTTREMVLSGKACLCTATGAPLTKQSIGQDVYAYAFLDVNLSSTWAVVDNKLVQNSDPTCNRQFPVLNTNQFGVHEVLRTCQFGIAESDIR